MKNGILVRKLEALDNVLNEINSLGKITQKQLEENWVTRRAVERDLQVVVEILVDLCQRIIALRDEAPATSAQNAIQRCIDLGILSPHPSYTKMVQFRNFIVHRYERVDLDILVDIVNNRLDDVARFREEILRYVQA